MNLLTKVQWNFQMAFFQKSNAQIKRTLNFCGITHANSPIFLIFGANFEVYLIANWSSPL